MYYLYDNGVDKSFKDARSYVLAYAKYYRDKMLKTSTAEISKIINELKKEIKLIEFESRSNDEDRLAIMLSEKQGCAEDFVDFVMLILYGLPDLKVYKFSMLLADKDIVLGTRGSTTNPIVHFGICYKCATEKVAKVRYIDFSLCLQSLESVMVFYNTELRRFYANNYYYRIINRIWNLSSQSIEEFYKEILTSDIAMPKGVL